MKKQPAKKSSKPRVKHQQVIVLVDGAENYYEMPRAALERSRVSERRKKKIVETLEDKDKECEFIYINQATIPGSTVSGPMTGGRQLHYAGFYLNPVKPKPKPKR